MDERIQALRREVDRVNRELLRLLSERGRLVQEIGRIQTELGLPHYDPKREEEMLAYLTRENPGPFPATRPSRGSSRRSLRPAWTSRRRRTRRSSSTPGRPSPSPPRCG
jgi:hypothetical protein